MTQPEPAPARSDEARQVRAWLLERDFGRIEGWARGASQALRELSAFLYEDDERLRWRAIAALGRAAAVRAEANPEAVRNFLRRQFFSMNEESGNVGWHAPEAIGEILAQVEALLPEYAAMLAATLHRPPFERGTHWAVARLAEKTPEVFAESAPALKPSLNAADPYLRAYAGVTLLRIGDPEARSAIQALESDPAEIRVYNEQTGEMEASTVGEMIRAARKTRRDQS